MAGLPMLRALAHRDFRYLQAGTQASQLGSWIQMVARGWLVYQLTGSPFQLGLVTFFQGLATVVATPIGGTLVDRVDRRRLLVISQVALTTVALALAVLIAMQRIQLWHVYLSAFLTGGFFSINQPARQAMVYDVVGREDLANAIALNSITMNAARVIGPSLAGVLLAATGVQGAFFAQAGCLVIAAWTTVMMRRDQQSIQPRQKPPFFREMATGVRYAAKDRTVASLLLISLAAAVLAWPFLSLMPAYSSEVLNQGSAGYGFTMAAVGVGAVGGALFIVFASDVGWKGKLLLISLIGNGIVLIALGAHLPFALIMALLILTGVFNAIHMAINQTLIQLHVADQYRGIVSALHFLGFGLQPIGALPAGAIAERWGVQAGVLVLGVALVVSVGVVALFSRRIARL